MKLVCYRYSYHREQHGLTLAYPTRRSAYITYVRDLSDIIAKQNAIAGEEMHALLVASPGESDALAKRLTPTHNAAALDIYLQGLDLLHHASSSDTADKAIERFGQALKEDSGFAKAQAGRSEERRVGKECGSTCRTRWSPYH